MNRCRNALVFAVLVAASLAASLSCRSSGPRHELTPQQQVLEERVAYLASKAVAARLVREGVASADDLTKAGGIVAAAATQDLAGALAAAGLVGDEWELLALVVQETLAPYQLEDWFVDLAANAGRGVRDGALGIADKEIDELHEAQDKVAPAPAVVAIEPEPEPAVAAKP